MDTFNPKTIKEFRFLDWKFDEKTYTVYLRYAFDNDHIFTEEFSFPVPTFALTDKKREALEACLKNLHLAAGISYYKAAIPNKITIENYVISPETARFFNKLYLYGLGEFAYKNKVDLQGHISFPYVNEPFPSASKIELGNRMAVPVGGGKDSIVTIETLKKLSIPLLLISVGNASPIIKTAEVAKLPHIVIKRKISPLILELNELGALNGHVPISAIISFAIAVAAVLYDFNYIVMSNERSANIGNLWHDGIEINHQYSKSLEFEKDISSYLQENILENLRYFSFLRPLSELMISKVFCGKCQPYHDIFASCTTAFRLTKSLSDVRWCLSCAKCRFVFAMMAPFMSKEKLIDIFGKNLLNEQEQISGFLEIMGYGSHKPFSCIGESEETIAAFVILSNKVEWQNDVVVAHFTQEILPKLTLPDTYVENALLFSENHLLEPDEKELLLNNIN
ncbi:endonuclease domain-containing protein [Candidatus Uabimicrobium sp. HlEnr_7]|uniref:endonuclease domain-containing protein n=1 Tax=Candidatus Uabimicrobium helgolandensis TaxID=3095367 RepID=UPI0035591BF8